MKIMQLNFGKYEGKCLERLMLTDAGYVNWMLNEPNPTGPLKEALEQFSARVDQIDVAPWKSKCFGEGCNSKAELLVVWKGSPALRPYCTACSPYRRDKREPKWRELEGYMDVLGYARSLSKSKGRWTVAIRTFMEHKGLIYNQRVSDYDLVAFFGMLDAISDPAPTVH